MRYGLTTRDFLSPAREFSPWFEAVDEVMDRLLVPMAIIRSGSQEFNPACDVEETDSHYLMSFDLPGISKDDLKIEVVDKQLTIAGERKLEKKDDKNSRHVAERYYGSFKRTFTIPSAIDSTKVEASYKDGVLQIAVPKAEAVRPQQVKISDVKGGIFSKLLGQKNTRESEREVSVKDTHAS
jgi:HSP20 family protein